VFTFRRGAPLSRPEHPLLRFAGLLLPSLFELGLPWGNDALLLLGLRTHVTVLP
jgi:hypothetical protein